MSADLNSIVKKDLSTKILQTTGTKNIRVLALNNTECTFNEVGLFIIAWLNLLGDVKR